METACKLAAQIEERLLIRNEIIESFFSREAGIWRKPAARCRNVSLQGGRLLAFGRGPYATDAQHVSVEFVHPVIVGKRASSRARSFHGVSAVAGCNPRSEDIVMGFGPPEGDSEVLAALASAHSRRRDDLCAPGPEGRTHWKRDSDPFIHQEMVEIFYHTLWETVHVFFEHRELGQDVGQSEFLYPFLGQKKQETTDIIEDVAAFDPDEGA